MQLKESFSLVELGLNLVVAWAMIFIVPACKGATGDPMYLSDSTRQSPNAPTCTNPDKVMCGPNGLYLILRLYGISVEPESIKPYIPSHAGGMSLLELRDALKDFGLAFDVRRCSVAEMCDNFQSPALALTNFYSEEYGHYMVVLGANRDWMYLMDATTGRVTKNLPQKVENVWKGYILVPHRAVDKSAIAIALVVSVGFWSIVAYRISRFTSTGRWKLCRNGSKQQLAGLMVSIVGLSAIMISCGTIGAATSDGTLHLESEKNLEDLHWRFPRNDGINSLYLQLRLLGYSGSYEVLYKQSKDLGNVRNLKSLSMLAKNVGVNLVPRKLTYFELSALAAPALIHLEEEGIVQGSFNLYLGESSQSVNLVEGAFARWIQTPRDHFKRAWTGYALIFQPVIGVQTIVRRFAALALIVYAILLALRKFEMTNKGIRRQRVIH